MLQNSPNIFKVNVRKSVRRIHILNLLFLGTSWVVDGQMQWPPRPGDEAKISREGSLQLKRWPPRPGDEAKISRQGSSQEKSSKFEIKPLGSHEKPYYLEIKPLESHSAPRKKLDFLRIHGARNFIQGEKLWKRESRQRFDEDWRECWRRKQTK